MIYKNDKSTWDKEDEQILNAAILHIKNETYNYYGGYSSEDIMQWLKSLRHKKQWEPNDEQMAALCSINVTGGVSYAGQGQELINLYNDLKKLMEE